MAQNSMNPELLYSLLPHGLFDIDSTFNKIMEYSPYQRFPTPKYEFHDVLSSWYKLIRKNKVSIINSETAQKL